MTVPGPELIAALETALRDVDGAAFQTAGENNLAAGTPITTLVNFAIRARKAAMTDAAGHVLRCIVASTSQVPRSVYAELAFQQRLSGCFSEAAQYYREALACPGSPYRTSLSLAHMLYADGEQDEADAILASLVPAGERERNEIRSHFEFGRYLREYPPARALAMLETLKASGAWLQHNAYAGQIIAAQSGKRPFSLLRVGDGEGACLTLGSVDEAEYAALYDANRQNRIAMWFGNDFPWRTNGFLQTSQGLTTALREADVIGIPDIGWLRQTYRISSITGIPSLVNILRALLSPELAPFCTQLCGHAASVELHVKGHIEKIIRSARDVSIISCLPDLPGAIKTRFDLDSVTLYQIPGEEGSRAALGDSVTFGAHYPEKFDQLTAMLAVPHDGRLFLIAGGLLGKLYAATIRRHGGIALDVGSLVDSWMSRKTRPGEDIHLRLGAAPAASPARKPETAAAPDSGRHLSEHYLESRFQHIKGMSSKSAAVIACRLMREQSEQAIRGNVVEIGVYEGRFFIGLALCTTKAERCVAIDTFAWPDAQVRERFLANCESAGISLPQVIAEQARSDEITPQKFRALTNGPVRFMHIDGGHGYDAVSHDLRLAKSVLHVGGILCLDDVLHPQFPELTIAVSDFLKSSKGFELFAIIDRESFTASCKFLICRRNYGAAYKASLTKHFPDRVLRQRANYFSDEAIILKPLSG